jgi:hypothetical protein
MLGIVAFHNHARRAAKKNSINIATTRIKAAYWLTRVVIVSTTLTPS